MKRYLTKIDTQNYMAYTSRMVLLIVLLHTAWGVFASKPSGTFFVSNDIRDAYSLVLELRLKEADAALHSIQNGEPDNLLAHYVADYIDFFTVFIDDDLNKYQSIKSDREMRLRLVRLGDVPSPYYLYVQAEIYIHRAILRMKFDENFGAATDLNQAFKLLKRNQRRFPDFTPNLKSLGMLKAAFGTIPDSYRWAIELFSNMEGTVAEGMQDLESSLGDVNQLGFREAQYCYMLALMYFQNAPDRALAYGRTAGLKPASNVLDCFALSHIALKSGQNDLALRWLESRPQFAQAYAIPYFDLMLGTAKLHRLDADAHIPLLRFLDTYQGKNYRKEALLKLAWHALIHSDLTEYQEYINLCKSAGCEVLETDRYAMTEARKTSPPHIGLLKARLLFDGGYYLKALEVIEKISFDELNATGQLEYRYRSGRIYQELERHYDALFAYKMTISAGKTSGEYYGCAAALYAGILYEEKGETENAGLYYNICLGIEPTNYGSGLHQKAKAGLSRLKAKEGIR